MTIQVFKRKFIREEKKGEDEGKKRDTRKRPGKEKNRKRTKKTTQDKSRSNIHSASKQRNQDVFLVMMIRSERWKETERERWENWRKVTLNETLNERKRRTQTSLFMLFNSFLSWNVWRRWKDMNILNPLILVCLSFKFLLLMMMMVMMTMVVIGLILTTTKKRRVYSGHKTPLSFQFYWYCRSCIQIHIVIQWIYWIDSDDELSGS